MNDTATFVRAQLRRGEATERRCPASEIEAVVVAVQVLLARNQQGDKVEVTLGTGGRLHVKTYRRGF